MTQRPPTAAGSAPPASPSSSAVAENGPALARFVALGKAAAATGRLVQLMLVAYQGGLADIEVQGQGLQRVIARAVLLRGEPHLSLVLRFPTKDITQNLPQETAWHTLATWLRDGAFRNAHLFTPTEEVQLAFSKKGKATVRVGKVAMASASASASAPDATAPQLPSHNREKHRLLELSRPFLRELGVTDAQGRLVPAMSRKWKQINKFIEVFAAALARSPLGQAPLGQPQPIHVVDFGSGKGYLTFAIHDWLRHTLQREARVTGVELRDDLVALCRGVIDRLQLDGMDYEQGDVRDYHPAQLNVMIALHACDIATDHAIHLGIRAGAEVILCSPCCHKEVRPQLLNPHPLRPILQHGIHQAQEAEMLTDGLRAMLLDAVGYDTQVFEFISLEHTNKNKMILAVKRAEAGPSDAVVAQIRDIKAFYGIQAQCLEKLLRGDGLLPA